MRATVDFVRRKIAEFNVLMFAGRLPEVPVRITDSASTLGMCVSKTTRLGDGRLRHHDFELRISARADLSERELEDVIIHEMIHYFIHYNGLQDSSPHGDIFKSLMRSINASFKRNITISHRYTPEQHAQVRGTKRGWHVIAAIRFRGGKAGVKVLPRVEETILKYYRAVIKLPDVKDVDLYLSDSPFFNRYPNSGALRIYEVSASDLDANLEDAERLAFERGHIVKVNK